jgi:hypothetical protein
MNISAIRNVDILNWLPTYIGFNDELNCRYPQLELCLTVYPQFHLWISANAIKVNSARHIEKVLAKWLLWA